MTVRYTATFLRQLKRLARKYRRIRHDLGTVTSQLLAGETPGDQVQHTGYTVYQVRVRNSDVPKGKSGGYRVIYYIRTTVLVTLLMIYSKTEQTDISPETISRLIEELE